MDSRIQITRSGTKDGGSVTEISTRIQRTDVNTDGTMDGRGQGDGSSYVYMNGGKTVRNGEVATYT